MVSAGAILEELVERAADRQHFYRPGRRPAPGVAGKPCKTTSNPLQMELFPLEESAEQMFERLFPPTQ